MRQALRAPAVQIASGGPAGLSLRRPCGALPPAALRGFASGGPAGLASGGPPGAPGAGAPKRLRRGVLSTRTKTLILFFFY